MIFCQITALLTGSSNLKNLDDTNWPYLERVALLSVYHCFPGGLSDQTLDLFGPVLDAGGKPECPEKNLRKQVLTGNQVHITSANRHNDVSAYDIFGNIQMTF